MRSPRRIIDANANRSREALRLLEDLARFMLDDAPLSSQFKSIRHAVTQILVQELGTKQRLVAERDTPGDVGTSISVGTETSRSSALQLAEAAGSRLTEALRAIEECLKIDSPASSTQIERLRYEAYEIERLLLPRLARPDPFMRVCLLLTESLCTHHDWQTVAASAIEGGIDGIQLREKSLSDRELMARARWLVSVAQGSGVRVIVNDRPDIAALADADGVHLGQSDLAIEDARTILGHHALIGVTTSSVEEAKAAFTSGADMIGIGPVFASVTKPKPEFLGPEIVESLNNDEDLRSKPYLAISGIDANKAEVLAGLGCTGVAVSGAICGAHQPEHITRSIDDAMRTRAMNTSTE
jgi:thiamine-phosphate pyrophosphorylase